MDDLTEVRESTAFTREKGRQPLGWTDGFSLKTGHVVETSSGLWSRLYVSNDGVSVASVRALIGERRSDVVLASDAISLACTATVRGIKAASPLNTRIFCARTRQSAQQPDLGRLWNVREGGIGVPEKTHQPTATPATIPSLESLVDVARGSLLLLPALINSHLGGPMRLYSRWHWRGGFAAPRVTLGEARATLKLFSAYEASKGESCKVDSYPLATCLIASTGMQFFLSATSLDANLCAPECKSEERGKREIPEKAPELCPLAKIRELPSRGLNPARRSATAAPLLGNATCCGRQNGKTRAVTMAADLGSIFRTANFSGFEMNFISTFSPALNSNGATVFCVDHRSDLGSSFEPRRCNGATLRITAAPVSWRPESRHVERRVDARDEPDLPACRADLRHNVPGGEGGKATATFGAGRRDPRTDELSHLARTSTSWDWDRHSGSCIPFINARLHHRGSKLDPRSDLLSRQKTVAPFEFRTGLGIEMKLILNRRNLDPRSAAIVDKCSLKIRQQIELLSSNWILVRNKGDPGSEQGSLNLGSGKMLAQPRISGARNLQSLMPPFHPLFLPRCCASDGNRCDSHLNVQIRTRTRGGATGGVVVRLFASQQGERVSIPRQVSLPDSPM
ncbi:hypothetical protein PR048_029978 [Dryococelus australis]|uniref:Uncharacterized protein n=1 Tax=Dryococelus australis TaxID=614101 RepID=A0ABQ9GAB3_9NEOP|nr:hypothetical protein PR048_029978 [Dryococelus australis]